MSGRQAKAARRAARDDVAEQILQAHDRLHKDDVSGCHDLLHALMCAGEPDTTVAPLLGSQPFDEAFRALCTKTGARAVFVLIDPDRPGRLISGGDAQLCAYVDERMRS